jgi:hypothetical protein
LDHWTQPQQFCKELSNFSSRENLSNFPPHLSQALSMEMTKQWNRSSKCQVLFLKIPK